MEGAQTAAAEETSFPGGGNIVRNTDVTREAPVTEARLSFAISGFRPRLRCRLMPARGFRLAGAHPRGQKMSIEDDPKKPREDAGLKAA
jgi:hypothetical protein